LYHLLKPFLFALPPEAAHNLAFGLLKAGTAVPGMKALLRSAYQYGHPSLERIAFDLHFPNPVGLAAGLDKNAQYLHQLALLGFGHVEIGTVTPRPQPGNPKPRLFRLPADKALINRMGFNNHGADAVARRLEKRPEGLIVGGNIGKNKATANEDAVHDYELCFRTLHPLVDYFVVNVSSPNTPGLRELQEKGPLTAILAKLQEINQGMLRPKPLLLKIAPDLNHAQLEDIAQIASDTSLAGLIATNTTIERSPLTTSTARIESIGSGGLSGAPLLGRSNGVLQDLRQLVGPDLPIIGVGGITDAVSAMAKLAAGATLIQVYSGLVYRGPGLVKEINRALAVTA
jgi:dihydroorotate dehydrogenase